MDIIKTINRIIAERGLKKQSVAREIGITPQQFSDMLARRRIIKVEDISALCDALDISPNELFEYKKGAWENARECKQLFSFYGQKEKALPPEQKEKNKVKKVHKNKYSNIWLITGKECERIWMYMKKRKDTERKYAFS